MKLEQIKAAVAAGLTVNWSNSAYKVVNAAGVHLIVYGQGKPKTNCIGLTWSDGETLNGQADDFYVSPDDLAYSLDDTGGYTRPTPGYKEGARYVAFSGGFENLWVEVHSYLGGQMEVDEACELAIDLLLEKKWFADESQTAPVVVI